MKGYLGNNILFVFFQILHGDPFLICFLIVVLGLLCSLTGGLPTIHIDPAKGNTKLRQIGNLKETQVYPILIY